jgi:hypothetical protein
LGTNWLVVPAAVSDRGSQCPATLMSKPPCSLATPGPLAPEEVGQGSGQGPPQAITSTTSSPTEPQVPTPRLPPALGGGLGWAGTHEMSKILLPQATNAAERRPLGPTPASPCQTPYSCPGGSKPSPPRAAWGAAGGWERGQRREGTERRRQTPRDPPTRRRREGERYSYPHHTRTGEGLLPALPRETSGNKQKKAQVWPTGHNQEERTMIFRTQMSSLGVQGATVGMCGGGQPGGGGPPGLLVLLQYCLGLFQAGQTREPGTPHLFSQLIKP